LEESREENACQVRLVGQITGLRATSTRRIPVEDQDKRTEEQEDVEAHKHKAKVQASEDAPDSEGEDEDFELHRKTPKAL
jgi:hypothetical protein